MHYKYTLFPPCIDTDTDFSESEPLSSMPISAPPQTKQITIATAAVSQSEPEDVSGEIRSAFEKMLGMLKM